MALFLLIPLLLLSEAASDPVEVIVQSGHDATLRCRAADSSITAVEWSRADPKPDVDVLYRDEKTERVNPNFEGRVELVDRDLKDGDVSLTLKNVNINDSGTYECRVEPGGSRRRKRDIFDNQPIRTIRLQVTEPGEKSSSSNDEKPVNDVPKDGPSSPGLAVGVPVVLVLVLGAAVAVAGVLMYKRRQRPGLPGAAAYKQPDESIPLEN